MKCYKNQTFNPSKTQEPMNEAETRAELIDPALRAAGWGVVEGSRVRREEITLGRLQGAGAAPRRGIRRCSLAAFSGGARQNAALGVFRYNGRVSVDIVPGRTVTPSRPDLLISQMRRT